MKKFFVFMVAVFLICCLFGPKDKDLKKAREKNGLELYCEYDGEVFCYEKEFPHRMYVEDKNMKFVWYKLRYAYKPIYKPYMSSDGTQCYLDLETLTTRPLSQLQKDILNNVENISDNNKSSGETQELMISQIYTSKDKGFSFMYPEGWTIDEEYINGAVRVSSPYEPVFEGSVASILIGNGNVNETYFPTTLSEFEEVLSRACDGDIRVLSWDDILRSEHSAKKLVFTDSSDGVSFKQVLYFYTIDSEMYVIMCDTYETFWDTYEPIFEEIMNSYVITDVSPISSNMENNKEEVILAVEKTECSA